MQPSPQVLVFDTGPLSHIALAGWLGVVKAVVGSRVVVVPDAVADELRAGGTRDMRISAVLDEPWIQVRELRSQEELVHFARFSLMLVKRGRNLGEAQVLALAKATSGIAVVDDGAARRAAGDERVEYIGTLGLVVDAIHSGLLTVKLVSAFVDDLLATEYRLPLGPGGFEQWATENGLL